MSGHSKWANIKRRKGAQDARRGRIFTRLIKEITVAARMGGGDVDANSRLRLAVDRAKAASMPKDNILRAIAKGTGDIDMAAYEELTMEGYASGGVAIMVECLTDNRNRTASAVRHAFQKGGGNLGTTGCVAYLFKRRGLLTIPAEGVDEDELLLAALDAGAEDMEREDDLWEIQSHPEDLAAVRNGIAGAGFPIESAEMAYIPDVTVPIQGRDLDRLLRLVDLLEDCEDVQQVHHNAEISDQDLARIAQ